jgi:tRNA A-37 threonylcarbamoyl transferase component Bud32
MLNHWNESGFNVPKIVAKKIECIKEPYLVTSFIEGPSLREYLLGNSCSLEEKLELLTRFFKEMDNRHKLSINSNDPDIAHHDPSTDNVILAENHFYFLDFETPRKKRSVIELASIEVATICRWIVRDLGIDYVQEVLKRMVAVYKGQDNLLKPIVKRTCSRPFQFYHLWRDERKKVADPKDVTKYDIANALSELL